MQVTDWKDLFPKWTSLTGTFILSSLLFFADIAQILTVYYHFVTPPCMSCASAMFGASGEKENQNFILHDDKHTNIRHRTSD